MTKFFRLFIYQAFRSRLKFFKLLLLLNGCLFFINTNAAVPQAPIKKILLVVAMDNEAAPIISSFHLKKVTTNFSLLPMQAYIGKYLGFEIDLITNGVDPVYKVQNVGTEAATLTTYLGINYFHPNLVISVGTAGGMANSSTQIKDIFVSNKIYFFDRRIISSGYHQYGMGGYPSTVFEVINKKLKFKSGVICSGDSFDDNQTDYQMLINENCSAVDMEAAGVAWVSMLMKTPMFAMKGITNFVSGKNSEADFHLNFFAVTNELATKLKDFFQQLANTQSATKA